SPNGYISGIAVLDDRIAVASHFFFSNWFDCFGPPSPIYFLDPETLVVIHQVQPVRCVAQIIRDPRGPGFLGLTGGNLHQVTRFDPNGASVATATISAPGIGLRHVGGGLALSSDQNTLYVLYSEFELGNPGVDPDAPPVLLALDPRDFSVRASARVTS